MVPTDGKFFKREDFDSALKNTIIADEEYVSVKKLYKLIKI